MANDNTYDDWGDDPFAGDMDFDFDFDNQPKKGFFASVGSGFLSELHSGTIGSSEGRLKTARTLLPKSFGTVFDLGRELQWEKSRIMEEMKQNSGEMISDLQYIASASMDKIRGRVPNKIADKIEEFSSKDFSTWDKGGFEYGQTGSMAETNDDEIAQLISGASENQSSVMINIGRAMTNTAAVIGGKQLSQQQAGNNILVGIDSGIRGLLQYQKKVQAKNDAAKINLLARMHLTNAKYYKFMETAMHRSVQELKNIGVQSGKSEYEKTSLMMAGKSRLRDNIFTTLGSRTGGITGYLKDMFGKDSRESFMGDLGSLVGSARFGMEAGSDMNLNMGTIVGQMIAAEMLKQGPEFFKSGAGSKFVNRLKTIYPDQAATITKTYRKLERLGSVLSFNGTNAVGTINSMISTAGNFDEDYSTYEDYLSSLPEGKKPLSQRAWKIRQRGKNFIGNRFNDLAFNVSEAAGTRYNLKRRSLNDLVQPAVWTRQSEISLVEVIPGVLGKIHLSLEKLRTGNDSLKEERYDYSKGRFVSHQQAKKVIKKQLLNPLEFQSFSSTSMDMADKIDSEGTLSPKAKQFLAYRLARDADADKGFNPYNFFGMEEKDGLTPEIANEIEQVMRGRFGITDDLIDKAKVGGFDGLKARMVMPSDEGKALAADLSLRAKSLKGYVPNLTQRIDLLRNSGAEGLLREMGLIDTKNGNDVFNIESVWKKLRDTLSGVQDPNDTNPDDDLPGPTRNGFGNNNNNGAGPQPSDGNKALLDAINALTDQVKGIPTQQPTPENPQNWKTVETISTTLVDIKELNTQQLSILSDILIRQPKEGKKEEKPRGDDEVREEKRSIIERLKSLPGGLSSLFTKGMDKLMEHEPLVLGGLLGGLGAVAVSNPKAAALLAGGAAIMGGYMAFREKAKPADEADDNQDIYDDESEEPLLESRKLKAGEYFDRVLKRVISSWSEIKGPIVDTISGAVVSTKKLAGKLFGPDGRAVVLRGFAGAKDLAIKAFNFIDPLNRLSRLKNKIADKFYQMDVYKVGEKDPVLTRKGFENNEYFKRENETLVPLSGWNEINGAVYDSDGDVILTSSDVEDGLITKGGMKVEGMKSFLGIAKTRLFSLGSKLKSKVNDKINKEKGPGASGGSDVVRSVDRIYALLCKQFGYEPEEGAPEVSASIFDTIRRMGQEPNVRTNSLADKASKRKEKREEQFQDAVIDIAGNLNGGSSDRDPKNGEEKKGFLSSLLGFAKNPFGQLGILGKAGSLLFSFLTLGIKTLPAIVGGLGTLAKILTLGLLGKRTRDLTDAADAAGGGAGAGRRRRRTRRRATRGSRIKGGLKGGLLGGAMLGASMMLDADDEINGDDQDDGENTWKDYLSMGLTGTSIYQLGSGALSMAGIDLGVGAAVSGAASTAASATLSGLGTAGAFVAPLIFNPITLTGLAVGAAGYGIYSYYSKGKGAQYKLRMAQYGVKDLDSQLASKILAAEAKLTDYVVIRAGTAAIAQSAPLNEIFAPFLPDPSDKSKTTAFYTWFNLRFKPIYLTYISAMDTSGYKSLKAYDEAIDQKVYSTASAVCSSVNGMSPYPYMVAPQFDAETPIMTKDQTVAVVKSCLDDLKTYNDRHDRTEDGLVKEGIEKIQTQAEAVNQSENAGFFQSMKLKLTGNYEDKDDAAEINRKFPLSKSAADISISDLLPGGDKPLDPITALRLAAYGNTANMPWRVEAVLKLERYCEDYIKVIGEDARFTSTTGEMYNLFRSAFRADDQYANQWCTWFRDRFLPVCMAWVKFVKINRGVNPKDGWRSLSATSRLNVGKTIVELKVNVGGKVKSIWDIKSSPFSFTVSGERSDKVNAYLNNLDLLAKQASLKDPLEEAKKTSAQQVVTAVNPRSLGQSGLNSTLAQSQAPNDLIAPSLPEVKMAPITGSTDTSGIDLSGVVKSGDTGSDKGVSVPKTAAEQLIMKELMKAGFNDPRIIAEMLALANFESGGFKNTTENMKYRADRLMKIFPSRIKTMADAQRIAAMGPQGIANAVYGGRLGNTGPNDGWLYRGRGFIQLTGKSNYAAASKYVGKDLVAHPELVSEDPDVMAKTLIWYLQNGSTGKRLQSVTSSGFEYAAQGLNPNGLPDMPARTRLYNQYLTQLQGGTLKPSDDAGNPAQEKVPGSVTSVNPSAIPGGDNVAGGAVDAVTANLAAGKSAADKTAGVPPVQSQPSPTPSSGSTGGQTTSQSPAAPAPVPPVKAENVKPEFTSDAKPKPEQRDASKDIATAHAAQQTELLGKILTALENSKQDPRLSFSTK